MNPIEWEGKTNSHRYEEKKILNDQNSLFLKQIQIKSKMNILLFSLGTKDKGGGFRNPVLREKKSR